MCKISSQNMSSNTVSDMNNITVNILGSGVVQGDGEGRVHGEDAAVRDLDLLDGLVAGPGGVGLDGAHHPAEHDMLAVQPGGLHHRDEELGAVGITTSVGHRQPSSSIVLYVKVLVFKFVSIDGLSASTVPSGEVSPLQHELLDNPVEAAPLVTLGLGSLGQGVEVLHGAGNLIAEQPDLDPAGGLAPDGDVEEDLLGDDGPGSLHPGVAAGDDDDQGGDGAHAAQHLHDSDECKSLESRGVKVGG